MRSYGWPDMQKTTFDEANARLTEQLCGRVIQYVYREGLDLVFVTMCGHEVRIAATVDHHIVHKRTDVKVMLQGVSMLAEAGKF